jgi:single-stranded-DNA-specific exonuclease
MHPLLAKLLAARGVRTPEEIFSPIQDLAPVSSLMNAGRMAVRLVDLIEAGKKIVVVADYDCDGATACTVAILGLRRFGAKVDFVVPDRATMGYGLTPAIVEYAWAQTKPDVLLTVDNGISSHEGIAAAARRGLPVLVTDHHLPGEALPAAECIVNPNQPGCSFPSKNLAGVGVMFYVLLAVRQEVVRRGKFTEEGAPRVGDLLDLVALGTVADVVKLDRNNRILVRYGLERIRQGLARPLITSLFSVAKRDISRATTRDLAFSIGPRLNAAGRIADMSLGIRGALCDDRSQASAIASQLDAINRERREMEASMQEDAIAIADVDSESRYSLTLFDPAWHQGIVGLVASRIRERYHRPTIAFAEGLDGDLKGSGRSLGGLHLRDALDLVDKRNPGLIIKFGGHAAAAGLTIRGDGLARFVDAFEAVARELLSPSDLDQAIECDGHAFENAPVNLAVVDQLEEIPWGQGFPPPQFAGRFRVLDQRPVSEGRHLKLRLATQVQEIDAIYFGRGEPLPEEVDLVYQICANEYLGQRTLQLIVQATADGQALEHTIATNARRAAGVTTR